MSCKNCGSPFHEIWDCPKPPRNPTAGGAQEPLRIKPQPSSNLVQAGAKSTGPHPAGVHPVMEGAGSIPAPVDTDKRKIDRHKPGYQAAKQREYRAKRKLKK